MPVQKIGPEALESDVNYFPVPAIIIPPSTTDYTQTNLKMDFEILGIDVKTATSTLDLQVLINATPVQWTTAAGDTLSVTTSPQEDTAASAATFSSGDDLSFSVDLDGGTPTKLELTLHCRRI
tara:strand:+ start:230 stop:598 length:369 start_codon:yes stop_codon:yes gene_type:complete